MLSPSKQKAIAALLQTKSNEDAALVAGVSARTIQAYLADPEFQAAYRVEIDKLIDRATMDLKRGMADAIQLQREIIQNTNAPLSNRQAASRTILEYGLRYSEFNDILKELRTLAGDS